MKDFLPFLAFLVVIAIVAMLGYWVTGWMHSVTTTVSIVTPKPGIECALATADKGIALSCWPAK